MFVFKRKKIPTSPEDIDIEIYLGSGRRFIEEFDRALKNAMEEINREAVWEDFSNARLADFYEHFSQAGNAALVAAISRCGRYKDK